MRAKIPSEVQALRELVLTQARQIQELQERVELLERENAKLRSRLGQTSRNSHRPPSSDGYRKKTTRPALPKQCWVCQREFKRKDVRSWGVSRQVFDLPAVRLRVTEHRLAEVCCCEQIYLSEFAAHVPASVQYGPNLRALATKLSIKQRLPSAQVAGLLNELYGLLQRALPRVDPAEGRSTLQALAPEHSSRAAPEQHTAL